MRARTCRRSGRGAVAERRCWCGNRRRRAEEIGPKDTDPTSIGSQTRSQHSIPAGAVTFRVTCEGVISGRRRRGPSARSVIELIERRSVGQCRLDVEPERVRPLLVEPVVRVHVVAGHVRMVRVLRQGAGRCRRRRSMRLEEASAPACRGVAARPRASRPSQARIGLVRRLCHSPDCSGRGNVPRDSPGPAQASTRSSSRR